MTDLDTLVINISADQLPGECQLAETLITNDFGMKLNCLHVKISDTGLQSVCSTIWLTIYSCLCLHIHGRFVGLTTSKSYLKENDLSKFCNVDNFQASDPLTVQSCNPLFSLSHSV